jgi:hypothetical protein
MTLYRLSKSKLLSGLQCPKRLYLEVHRPELAEVSDETERVFSNGHLVGGIARSQHPAGKLIGSTDSLAAALSETEALLKADTETVLFEPAFSHGGVLIRADIFSRTGDKAHLVEVKSSTAVKGYHYNDAAIQYWVITGAGYPLRSVSISHIDSDFVYPGGGDYRGLLKQMNVTDEILPLIEAVPLWVKEFQKVLAGGMPDIAVGQHCSEPFECPFWGFCSEGQSEFPVDILPHGGQVVVELLAEGYRDLRDVPLPRLANPKHQRVWRATKSGEPEFDRRVRHLIRSLPFPRFYLDFETIQFAVPIWAGTRPYEQLPFQWSCHIEGEGRNVQHREFLDVSGNAPMRSFAESLIATVGGTGPILVYGHFEARIVRELAERFPDLDVPLTKIVHRIKNLHPITEDHYYHPAMRGSWSLKAVLPTVAPELSYDQLGDVQDGGAAQAAYLEIIDAANSDERRAKLENDLRDYCRTDSLALVRLARFLSSA